MKDFFQDLKYKQALMEQRQKICELIHSHPKFGSDYTTRFIWDDNEHPYKNLANYLIWCEYLIKEIKTLDELEHRRPRFNSEKTLAKNKNLHNEIQKAYESAITIKKYLFLNNNVDFEIDIPKYYIELEVFKMIDCDLGFLRPKLQKMQKCIKDMFPIMERNKIITNDFRNCFINCGLSIELLRKNLNNLTNKYGQDILNEYAKYAWYFYNSFDIKTILEETEMLLSNLQIDDNTIIVNEIFIKKIEEHFFIEFYNHCDAYKKVEQILNNVLTKHATNWNMELIEQIEQLYAFKLSKNRSYGIAIIKRKKLIQAGHFIDFVIQKSREDYDSKELNRTRGGSGDLLWRLAIRGFLVDNFTIHKLELTIENHWQIYHYKIMVLLNKFITINQDNLINSNLKELVITIKDYVYNKNLCNLYKLVLFFIGENLKNIINDNNLMGQLKEIKEMTLLSLKYNEFKLIE